LTFSFTAWFWGDPHFVTLDGKNYTFNGLGEYVMLDAKDGYFQLQARTKPAKGEGTATVFSGAVAKERNTSTVQVTLADNGKNVAFSFKTNFTNSKSFTCMDSFAALFCISSSCS
jgi:hypothetical protein